MKKAYNDPKIEVLNFNRENIVTTSAVGKATAAINTAASGNDVTIKIVDWD